MPELPEVETTVNGLNKTIKGLGIKDVWTEYKSAFHKGKENIKDPRFFTLFRKNVIGAKVLRSERKGKNILIRLSNKKTILIHMKMTGHLLYGKFRKQGAGKGEWVPDQTGPLNDPFNRFLRLVFVFSNGKHLAFSDMRKFATVTFIDTSNPNEDEELSHLGTDALQITASEFHSLLGKDKRPIKQMLLDQTKIAGIGNIYSDEMLWQAGIHPRSNPSRLKQANIRKLFSEMKKVLKKGIDFGGDSMSDYRNVYGERGKFQEKHNVYRRKDLPCKKKNCSGIIKREVIGGRSGHFCPVHQKLYK